jgi:hypothetical protein
VGTVHHVARQSPEPTSVLLWRAEEFARPGAVHACCLRTTVAGARAVVYRTGSDRGIAGVLDFGADAAPRPQGGWAAPGTLVLLDRPLTRAELLADEDLHAVFASLRSRRSLPGPAARRLAELIDAG